nr:putative carotenoid oxygenase [Penicillium meliponae]
MRTNKAGNVHQSNGCLRGNFAPIKKELTFVLCEFSGIIPAELHGGQYVRNGANPSVGNGTPQAGDMHMFDGDGMMTGVYFRVKEDSSAVKPCFVNRYVLTDIYLANNAIPGLDSPILPSVATLSNPLASTFEVLYRLFRFVLLLLWSHIRYPFIAIRTISAANTAVLFHDRRALATCQTGPPMTVQLPGLETIGWYNGHHSANECVDQTSQEDAFGRDSLLGFLKDWVTAHPHVDQRTGELISFQSSFMPPYVWYSVIPKTDKEQSRAPLHASVPGISSPKFMHDFGVSPTHTVILDLPMSLDPTNLLRGKPIIDFNAHAPSRFGIFPRYNSFLVRWFESDPCFIFHTAATWDEYDSAVSDASEVMGVSMLACRYTGAGALQSMGSRIGPRLEEDKGSPDDGQLYYYQFSLSDNNRSFPIHEFGLSVIPFEMPNISPLCSETAPRFVYGCSSTDKMFGAKTGEPMKIDCLVKIDVQVLIKRGLDRKDKRTGIIDERQIQDILSSGDLEDPIKVFQPPAGWCAQEPCFVPRENGESEDDGYLLTLLFDESQLEVNGAAPDDSHSELWVIDARDMKTVVGKIVLPQRAPYGFHGRWFTRDEIEEQRLYISTRTAMPSSA